MIMKMFCELFGHKWKLNEITSDNVEFICLRCGARQYKGTQAVSTLNKEILKLEDEIEYHKERIKEYCKFLRKGKIELKAEKTELKIAKKALKYFRKKLWKWYHNP